MSSQELRELAISLTTGGNLDLIVRTSRGILVGRRPDLGSLAFLHRINDPLSVPQFRKLLDISMGSDEETMKTIYSSFNGVGFHGGAFEIYGWTEEIDRSDPLSTQNIPFSIYEAQVNSRPRYSPSRGCIIARLRASLVQDMWEDEIYDLIDEDGCIVSGKFRSSNVILERFSSLHEWLAERFAQSMEVFRKGVLVYRNNKAAIVRP